MIKIYYIFKRLALEKLSYRMALALEAVSLVGFTLTFYFISKLFGAGTAEALARYRGDYFSFVLIGLAFQGFLWSGLQNFSTALRTEQLTGSLEAVMATPTPLGFTLFVETLYNLAFNLLYMGLFFASGVFLFHARYETFDPALIGLVLLLTFAVHCGLGLISAGFVMVYKKGDPVVWAVGGLSTILGGVYFPVEVMPGWLQNFAAFMPITYSLRLMRDSLMLGHGFQQALPGLAALAAQCVVVLPLSLWVFNRAVNRARRDGTVSHY